MQHALLAFAIALIVAIAAALAAPAYIDWNDWRAHFEERATVLAGTPVRIRGKIDATLLPTPAFVLRDVEAGDPDKGAGIRVGEVRGILSLGALLRGTVEAEEFVLARPAVRLVIESGDRPVLGGAAAVARATGIVALARLTIERGSVTVEDRATSEISLFEDIFAEGEVRGRQGPMKIDGTFRRDNRRWGVRANAGQFSDAGSGRVRLTLEQSGSGLVLDADGMVTLSGTAPRFDGKLLAARRGSNGTPWQITANVKASEAAVGLDGFELTLGADAAPTELAGLIQFTPRRGGQIDGTLSARRLDLDAAAGAADAAKRLPDSLATLRELSGIIASLPLQGRVGLFTEALIAGSGTVRTLKADVGFRNGALALERLEAGLPGRGTIKASGTGSGADIFAGDASVEAEDSSALVRWAFGQALPGFEADSPVRTAGKVKWSGGRIEVDALDFALAEAKLGGGLAVVPGDGKRRTRIETKLTANNIDLDLFAPVVEMLRSGTGATDLVLGIQGNTLRLLGKPVRRLDASVSRTEEAVAIDRLVVEDFDGLSGRAQGRIAAPVERPSGTIEFTLDAARPDGVAAIAAQLLGADASALVRRLVSQGRTLKLKGKASGAGAAAGVEVSADGQLGDLRANLDAHFDLLSETLSEAQFTLTAQESGKLISLLGLTPGPPSPGEGVLEVNFASTGEGVLPVMARLSVPGANISAEGELRSGSDGRIEPRLDLRLDAVDLRPMLAAAGRSRADALAGDGTAKLVRAPDTFSFENISLNLGGARVRGALTASGLEKPAIGGKLSVERMEIATLLGMILGSAQDSGALWSAARLSPAPLAGASGTVEFDVAALSLSERFSATATKFKLRLGANDAAIEDFTGDFAGGKLAGRAHFVQADTLAFDGRAKLDGFDLSRVLAPGTWKADARGRGNFTLSIAGSGRTPAALASSLSGQGTIVLEGLEIDRVDPGAIAAVFNVQEKNEPRDEIGVIAALAPALAKGSLRLAKVEAPVIVAGGIARSGKARTSNGNTQVAAEASVDIAKLTFDGAVELEIAPPPGMTVRPGATVHWRGPLAAPERGIEAAALATAITLRAVERETKRIEERDRALPPLQPQPHRSEPAPAAPNPLASAPATPAELPLAASPPAIGAPAGVSADPPQPARPRPVEGQPRVAMPPLAPPIEIRPAPPIFQPR